MKVSIGPEAQEELDAIRRWIARDNRPCAISFTRELAAYIENSLAYWPGRFPEVDPSRFPGLHRLNYRGHRIFYAITNDQVNVLHIHHGSRGYPDA